MALYVGNQRVCPVKIINSGDASAYIGYLEDIKTVLTELGITVGSDYSTYDSTISSSYNAILDELQNITGGSSEGPIVMSLTVTPTTSSQVISAPDGVMGYTPITVNAVTSAIDSNITAGNIKNGVNILGVTGTYTGSGVSSTGILIESDGTSASGFTIKSVGVTDVSATQYMFNKFYQFGAAISSVDLSSIESISGQEAFAYAFQLCTSLSSVSFTNLASLTGYRALYYCFKGCTSLTSLSFPALTSASFSTNNQQLSYMLQDVTGCTVHFPSNLQSVIGSWGDVTGGFGGTSTTVLFDLPATT